MNFGFRLFLSHVFSEEFFTFNASSQGSVLMNNDQPSKIDDI